ncbi:hypothetical protein GSI_03444 [Ganoderma sinense ZZ0214-1]|uniref:Uncharacterized protein n=1 Tax=Ganoderma sinense ZZ0214-1 TaxID=1077348 RepID=A0A2G8SLM2_9APHY|nr:hypothetical protein GSI_03444 [Ganoderma sinense ZZ0214-1]
MLNLPNELIALVLEHLSEGPTVLDSSWPLQSSSNAWFPLALTCHRIHDVAVSTQDLWRRIAVFSRAGGLDVAFSRSGDLEIDVIFHEPLIIAPAFMQLAQHTARLRTLIVVEGDRNTHLALRFLLSHPMPALTTCQVHVVSTEIPPYRAFTDSGMRFPVRPDFVPNLRALQLGILGLDWTSDVLPRLRKLSLRDSFPQDYLTFDTTLGILASCTALEHLELRYSKPFRIPVTTTERSAGLPHLRTFILESLDYEVAFALLSHLHFSEHADVDVKLDINTDVAAEAALTIPEILPLDPARLPLLACATFAHFSFLNGVFFECAAPARGPGRLHAFLDPASEEDIDEGWLYTPSEALEHFYALLEHAPLRALKLQVVWPYAEETCAADGLFADVFEAFPALEELEYYGNAGAGVASDRQLLDVLAGGALPRLSTVQLWEWNEGLVGFLIEALQIRATGGLRLSQLDIRLVAGGEGVPGAALQELYGLVDGEVKGR